METSPLIWSANCWTGFYMIGTSVMKEIGTPVVNVPVSKLKKMNSVIPSLSLEIHLLPLSKISHTPNQLALS